MSRITLDGRQYISREEFLAGRPGIYKVETAPIKGFKNAYCSKISLFNNRFFSIENNCKLDLEVPIGETIVSSSEDMYYYGAERLPISSVIHARATGIRLINPPANSTVRSGYDIQYQYDTKAINRPKNCDTSRFFSVHSRTECGMHFAFITEQEPVPNMKQGAGDFM